jgi:TolB-like protein/DNA-binding winged helix-turn-helix (wHTH) protein/Flp pilus assembly protein TadD
MQQQAKQIYEFGPFHLDTTSRILLKENVEVPLRPKVFETLLALVEANGQLVTKEALLQRLCPDSFVEEGVLPVNISALRKALGENRGENRYIITVPGRGYQFVAAVKELDEDIHFVAEESIRSHFLIEHEEDRGEIEQMQRPALNGESTEPQGDRQTKVRAAKALTTQPIELAVVKTASNTQPIRRIRVSKRILSAVLILSTITAAGIYGFYFFANDTGDSIAVLPFTFISKDPKSLGDSDSEYFSDGITENVINRLSQFSRLKVIARSSVFYYQDKGIDPKQAGRELGVHTVLIGRIIQRGENLTIKTELLDVQDNRQIWGEQYDRKISDLPALQREIASSIVSNLKVKLTGTDWDRLAKSHTDSPEADDLYKRGRYYWNKRTVAGFKTAIDFFQRAIAIDSQYAQAYSGLADSYMLLSDWGGMDSGVGYAKAREAVMQALSIDDGLAEAHTSLAGIKAVLDWDWTGAENEYRRAIELNPGYSTAHQWYATHLMVMGRMDEAIAQIQQAKQLDPLSLGINKDFAIILLYARRYDQALAQCKKTLEIEPTFLVMSTYMAQIYDLKQMYTEAIAEAERAEAERVRASLPEDPEISCALGLVFAGAGRTDEAQRILNELIQPSKRDQFLPKETALLYARLGNKDKAFEILQAAYESHYFPVAELNIDSRFETLRSDPRFSSLLRGLKLEQ